MRRTILSSYLFLIPINLGLKYNDYLFTNMNAIGMGLSICNHSHSFHTDKYRRKLFRKIDVMFMHLYGFYIIYLSLYTYKNKYIFAYNISMKLLIIYLFFVRLQRKKYIEDYDGFEKWLHFLFHIISIFNSALTYKTYQELYYLEKIN